MQILPFPQRLPPGLFAFGNPALSTGTVKLATALHRHEKLLPLPDAEIEVKALARIYPYGNTKVFVGAEAQEGVAKSGMSRYRILHFATHGLLDNNNPMYSHIVLSQADAGKDEDGLLEAWEIMEINLKAEIAILSACERLGAKPVQALKLVIGHGMMLSVIGSVIGVGAAVLLTRLIAKLLFGVSPTDPLTFVVIPLLLAGVTLLACWVPARRATRVDPMMALRYD